MEENTEKINNKELSAAALALQRVIDAINKENLEFARTENAEGSIYLTVKLAAIMNERIDSWTNRKPGGN